MADGEKYILQMEVQIRNDKQLMVLEKQVKQLARTLPDSKALLGDMSKQFTASSKSARNMGYQIQNASYQLTDFFVMVQGGINPLRAMSQQLPQLLAGFGALGAAAGAFTAIGASVILSAKAQTGELRSLSDLSSDAADSMSKFVDSMIEYQRVGGSVNRELAAMRRELAEIDRNNLLEALAPQQGSVVGSFWNSIRGAAMGAASAIGDATNAAAKFLVNVDPNLAEAFRQLAAEDTARLAAENPFLGDARNILNATPVGSAGNFKQIEASFNSISELVLKARRELKQVPDEVQAVFDQIAAVYDPLKSLSDDFDSQVRSIIRADNPLGALRSDIEELQGFVKQGVLEQSEAWIIADSMAKQYQETLTQMKPLYEQLFGAFTSSFDGFVNGVAQGTARIEDLVTNMVRALLAQFAKLAAYYAIFNFLGGTSGGPIAQAFGRSSGILANAHGNVFQNGDVQPFARGGVVSSPTLFPMAKGMGLMGEAGAEAIMPLGRLPNGDLGVKSSPMNVVINNNAPGVDVTATQGEEGLTLDIVRAVVAADISRGGNAISQALGGSYGLPRAGV